MAYTYILRCADGSHCVGSTRSIDKRLWEHASDDRGPLYTRSRRPVELAFPVEFEHAGAAFAFEKQVQGWSRAKREALIRGDWAGLPDLAARGGPRPPYRLLGG